MNRLVLLACMAWLGLSFSIMSVPTAEAGCRWDGTAPSCAGKCNANEIQVDRRGQKGFPPTTPFGTAGEPNYGASCTLGGSKALCCTRCPSGQVWREAYGQFDVLCVTLDKRYRKDDGTCAPGKTCQAIPAFVSTFAAGTDLPGSDYRNFAATKAGSAECQIACSDDAGKCKAWTYVTQTNRCWLKTGVPAPRANKCCTSGVFKKVSGTNKP